MSHPAPSVRSMTPLTDTDHRVLAFERAWWKYAGAKEAAILDTFGWNATRYYRHLGKLIDKPAAMVADPMLVKRLRRIREERVRGPLSMRARARAR